MNHDPFVGRVIDGRYEIQQRVGEGGMGVVYKAKQISIDRVIALKMLNAEIAQDPNWVQRFYNEAKACSRLQHPNTIRMFDFGQTQDGRLFMTMEFLDGISLRQSLQMGPLAPQRVIKILIQCCASLAEAHSIGIIHRDIKPDNVFLLNMAGSPDFVKLLDFSVAKLLEGDRMKTQAGVVFGTPQYMSPEQGRGMPLDARSDLYALGILAFEMLTGNVPFNDENPMNVIHMHLQGAVPPMPDSIPYPVQAVVRRALEKDPARRYQSAGEMMQHCQQVFAELSQSAGGGVAVGAAGMPRTVIAPGPQMQQVPQQMQGQPPMQGPGGYVSSAPQAKTMMAQSPFSGPHTPSTPMAAIPPGTAGGAPMGPGGFAPAGHQQKTIVAGMAPPMMGPGGPMPMGPGGPMPMGPGGQMPMGPGGPMHGQMPMGPGGPMHGQMPMGPGGPMHGQMPMGPMGMPPQGMPPHPGYPPGPSGPNRTVMMQPTDGVVSIARTAGGAAQGASTLYWIVCLATGIAVGVLAYVIVLQV